MVLISLWHQNNDGPIKLVGECFNLFNLEKSLLRFELFLLKYLVELTNDTICAQCFYRGKGFNY